MATLEERFWAKVRVAGDDECWIWQASCRGGGYGAIWKDGRSRAAHQVAWELAHGRDFPEGKCGCHRCDTPACVNPRHIFVGDHRDNALDAVSKGRLKPDLMSEGRRKQTRCKRGHEFTPENTYTWRGGNRRCRECQRIAQRIAYHRARSALTTEEQP